MATYLLYMGSPVIVYLILTVFSGRTINDNPKYRNIYLGIMFIIMSLMMGLKSPDIGSGDARVYFSFWETMSEVSFSELNYYLQKADFEIGYQFTTWVFSHIFRNGQWQLILSSIFFAFSVCCFVNKNCKNLYLALIAFNSLGLFNFMVQGLRQAVAMCICLWALEFCKQKKPIKFLFFIVLATLFHGSAVVFSVVYFVRFFKLDIKSFVITAILIILGIIFLPKLFALINKFINDNYELGNQASEGGIIAVIIYMAIILFGLVFRDREDNNYALFLYMSIMAMVAMVMRNFVSTIIERVALYFAFGEMVVLSNSVKVIKNRTYYAVVCAFAVIMCFGVAIYKSTYSSLVPYLFFWQG